MALCQVYNREEIKPDTQPDRWQDVTGECEVDTLTQQLFHNGASVPSFKGIYNSVYRIRKVQAFIVPDYSRMTALEVMRETGAETKQWAFLVERRVFE